MGAMGGMFLIKLWGVCSLFMGQCRIYINGIWGTFLKFYPESRKAGIRLRSWVLVAGASFRHTI